MNAPSSKLSLPRSPEGRASAPTRRLVRPTRDTLSTAAIAVGCLLVTKFAVAFVLLLGNAVNYDPSFYSNGFLESPIGLFLGSLVLYPFPFYLAAFAALALVFPILAESSLSTVLRRALLAGAGATVILALVGIVTGVTKAVAADDPVQLLLWVVFIPVAAGVQLSAVLVGGAAIAWLWVSRQEVSGDPDAETSESAETTSGAGVGSTSEAVDPEPAGVGRPGSQDGTRSDPPAPDDPEPRAAPPISIYAPPEDRPETDST